MRAGRRIRHTAGALRLPGTNNNTMAVTDTRNPPPAHPRGIWVLAMTEMWERFTYYGMRALLVLFLVSTVTEGGFGLDDRTAAAIYGLYTAGIYLMALPGGWIADRLTGQRNAILAGGVVDPQVGKLFDAFMKQETQMYRDVITRGKIKLESD